MKQNEQTIQRALLKKRRKAEQQASCTIREGSRLADVCIILVIAFLCFITLYPMYYVLIMSVSDPMEVIKGNIYWWPRGFSLGAYTTIFQDKTMWRSYGYTILYVVSETFLMEVTCLLAAYPLTCKKLIGRKYVVWFLLVPMYFGGGLIPTYLIYSRLGLYNNIWALIIPGSFSIYNIILMRTYLASMQEGIREAAKIDGANHFQILFRIYAPLAKPIMAVIAIYTIVGVWNSWFPSMVYQPNLDIQPLQMYLRRILVEQSQTTALTAEAAKAMAEERMTNLQRRYSMIIFTTLPIIFVYPFFQKYFIQGVMIGSLKE